MKMINWPNILPLYQNTQNIENIDALDNGPGFFRKSLSETEEKTSKQRFLEIFLM